MRILTVHNHYRKPGGEDVVFRTEAELLERHGHQVFRYTASNSQIDQYNALSLAARTIWNPTSRREIGRLLAEVRPDVMHVHNTLPLISPSIYGIAHRHGVAVVQTLHNFRLVCPGALLMRDGRTCEDCIGTATRWPAVVHRCYRNSGPASAAITAMLNVHTFAGTWHRRVDRYIALSEFQRQKFIAAGFPAGKLVVKPNCIAPDPGLRTSGGDYALFVGRLSPEKGLTTLLDAWRRIPDPPVLKIAGDGPMMPADRHAQPRVEWLGHQVRENLLDVMKGAAYLIAPSEWFEGWPLSVVDAFAVGLPVLASRMGALTEMVTEGVTGVLFEPKSPDALIRAITWAREHPGELATMALRARAVFEKRFSAEPTYQAIASIYEEAIQSRGTGCHVEGHNISHRDCDDNDIHVTTGTGALSR